MVTPHNGQYRGYYRLTTIPPNLFLHKRLNKEVHSLWEVGGVAGQRPGHPSPVYERDDVNDALRDAVTDPQSRPGMPEGAVGLTPRTLSDSVHHLRSFIRIFPAGIHDSDDQLDGILTKPFYRILWVCIELPSSKLIQSMSEVNCKSALSASAYPRSDTSIDKSNTRPQGSQEIIESV